MAGQRKDGGTTGGWRNDGRTAGRREDGETAGDNTPATLGAHWGLGDAEERRMMLLAKCTRRYVREGEGSGEKASIYMILAPTLAPCATPPAIPPRTTVTELTPYTAVLIVKLAII